MLVSRKRMWRLLLGMMSSNRGVHTVPHGVLRMCHRNEARRACITRVSLQLVRDFAGNMSEVGKAIEV